MYDICIDNGGKMDYNDAKNANTIEEYVGRNGQGQRLISKIETDLYRKNVIGILDANMFFIAHGFIKDRKSISADFIEKGRKYNRSLLKIIQKHDNLLIPDCIRNEIYGILTEELKYEREIRAFDISGEYIDDVKKIQEAINARREGYVSRAEENEINDFLFRFVAGANGIHIEHKEGREPSKKDEMIIALALEYGCIEPDKEILVYTNDKAIQSGLTNCYRMAISKNVPGKKNKTQALKNLRNSKIFVYGIGDTANKGRNRLTRQFESDIEYYWSGLEWEFRGRLIDYADDIKDSLVKALYEIDEHYKLKKAVKDSEALVEIVEKPEAETLVGKIEESEGEAVKLDMMMASSVKLDYDPAKISDKELEKRLSELQSEEFIIESELSYRGLKKEFKEYKDELKELLSKRKYDDGSIERIAELGNLIKDVHYKIKRFDRNYSELESAAETNNKKEFVEKPTADNREEAIKLAEEKGYIHAREILDRLIGLGYDICNKPAEVSIKDACKAAGRDEDKLPSFYSFLHNLKGQGLMPETVRIGKTKALKLSLDNFFVIGKRKKVKK